MESFNPVTISMGKEHGRYYFHFIAGEINVGSKNNWLNKKPMFLSEVEKNLGFRIVFVHYFESILKKENQLLMWHIFSHYPMWLSYPFHPLAWCPSCCTRFRASCPPRKPPNCSHSSCTTLYSHHKCKRILISTHCCQHLCVFSFIIAIVMGVE